MLGVKIEKLEFDLEKLEFLVLAGVFSFSRNMKSSFTDVLSLILQIGNFKILVRTTCEQKRF